MNAQEAKELSTKNLPIVAKKRWDDLMYSIRVNAEVGGLVTYSSGMLNDEQIQQLTEMGYKVTDPGIGSHKVSWE
jgi:hypothetical protein